MKVLHLCTSIKGGAGIACERLHQSLLKEGIDSHLLTADKDRARYPNSHRAVDLISQKRRVMLELQEVLAKVKTKVKERNSKIESSLFTFMNTPYPFISNSQLFKEADIIHLHWVANFLNYTSFFKRNKKPTLWTLHDMNPFTAGNHYSLTEDEIDANRNLISKQTQKKKSLLQYQNLEIIASSQWMKEASERSKILGDKPHHLIHFGLEPNIFKPRNKEQSREILDIPLGKKVILFAVNNIYDTRKGFNLLLEAIEKLNDPEILLCIMGNTYGKVLPKNANIHELGFVSDERMLSLIFSAADVFVTPAIEEAFGLTTIESLACGTPVIGFDTGIISEVIQDLTNGFICKEKNAASLASGINEVLKKLDFFDSSKISKEILSGFNEELQAKNHIEIYKKMIDKERQS